MDHVCQLHSCLRTKSCIRCRVLCVKRVTRVPWQSEMESGRRWFSFAWLWLVVCCFRPYCDSNPLRCCQCDATVGELAPVMSSSIPCLIPLSTLHHSVRPAVLSFESQAFLDAWIFATLWLVRSVVLNLSVGIFSHSSAARWGGSCRISVSWNVSPQVQVNLLLLGSLFTQR